MEDAQHDVIEVRQVEPDERSPDRTSNGRPWLIAVLLVAGVTLLALVIPGGEDATRSTADPSLLDAPEPPPSVTLPDIGTAERLSPEVAAVGSGWRTLDVPLSGFNDTRVAHGPAGWLVAAVGRRPIVSTSPDGIAWEERTLHGDSSSLGAVSSAVAVGDTRMIFAISDWDEGGGWTTAWLTSGPDDETWTIVPPVAGVVVDRAFVVDDTPYLIGRHVDRIEDVITGRGSQVVLRLDPRDGWRDVPVEGSGPSTKIASLVQGPDGVRGFGGRGGSAAGWREEDGRFVADEVSLRSPFLEVVEDPEGGWLAGTFSQILRSDDLEAWQALNDVGIGTDQRLHRVDDQIVASRTTGGNLLVFERSEVRSVGFERISSHRIADMASSGDVAVAVISFMAEPRVVIRGVDNPRTTVPDAVPGPGWTRRSELASRAPPVAAGVAGGGVYVHVGGSLHSVDVENGELDPGPAMIGVDVVVRDRTGEIRPLAGDLLYRAQRDGLWESTRLDSSVAGNVSTVGEIGGSSVVLTWSNRVRIESAPGEWEEFETPVPVPSSMASLANGLALYGVDASGDPATFVTADGESWERLDGELVATWGRGTDPFLRLGSDTIVLLSSWPDTVRFRLPEDSAAPVQVVHRPGETRVLTETDVLVTTDGSEWQRFPLDLEHGAPDPVVVLLPGDPLQVVVGDGRTVGVLRWE